MLSINSIACHPCFISPSLLAYPAQSPPLSSRKLDTVSVNSRSAQAETIVPENSPICPPAPVCHDLGICKGLHEAQHLVASGRHISGGRNVAPFCAEGAATAGLEIPSKLAGIFKPLQITLELCCCKQF